MKVIAVIEPACADTADRRPVVVRRILEHLGLPTRAPNLRAPPDQTNGLAGYHSRAWFYEPFLDDLPIPDPATA